MAKPENLITIWFDNEYLYMSGVNEGVFRFLAPKYSKGIQFIHRFNFAECTMTARFDIAFYDEFNRYRTGYCDATLNIGEVLKTMGFEPSLLINVEKEYVISNKTAYLLQIDLNEYADDFLITVTYLMKPQYKAVFSIDNVYRVIATNITDESLLRHISDILWSRREDLLEMWKNKKLRKLISEAPSGVSEQPERKYGGLNNLGDKSDNDKDDKNNN